jgi:hypothetical protein
VQPHRPRRAQPQPPIRLCALTPLALAFAPRIARTPPPPHRHLVPTRKLTDARDGDVAHVLGKRAQPREAVDPVWEDEEDIGEGGMCRARYNAQRDFSNSIERKKTREKGRTDAEDGGGRSRPGERQRARKVGVVVELLRGEREERTRDSAVIPRLETYITHRVVSAEEGRGACTR